LAGKILTNKRVGRQERKRHLKAFLEGLEFLLVHTGVDHHQKDGRHNLEKRLRLNFCTFFTIVRH
jgi:hypothetical protein